MSRAAVSDRLREERHTSRSGRVITVAVLGSGSIGLRHVDILRGMPQAEVIAIPTRLARLRQLKQTGYTVAADLEEAVGRGASHCIVATDTGRHTADALAAVERGLEVFIEKPLATDAPAAARLLQRAAQLHRQVFVGCVLRFSESLNRGREWLPSLGALHSVRIECQSYLPAWRPDRPYRESYSARAEEGGVLRDLIHEIDYAGWLFGWPNRLQGRLKNLGRLGIAAEELAHVSWETPMGCVVSVHLDYLSRPSRRRLTVSGERGTIEWDGIAETVAIEADGNPVRVERVEQTRDQMFAAQARAFLDATTNQSDPRLATGNDGLKALAVCDAARRASARRREEAVEYP